MHSSWFLSMISFLSSALQVGYESAQKPVSHLDRKKKPVLWQLISRTIRLKLHSNFNFSTVRNGSRQNQETSMTSSKIYKLIESMILHNIISNLVSIFLVSTWQKYWANLRIAIWIQIRIRAKWRWMWMLRACATNQGTKSERNTKNIQLNKRRSRKQTKRERERERGGKQIEFLSLSV